MKGARLIVRDHEGCESIHEISSPETLIGRSAGSGIRLTDPASSRDHACITWEADHYVIEDLQTSNGTKVNGKRIRSASLEHGDEIQMGQTVLTFDET